MAYEKTHLLGPHATGSHLKDHVTEPDLTDAGFENHGASVKKSGAVTNCRKDARFTSNRSTPEL